MNIIRSLCYRSTDKPLSIVLSLFLLLGLGISAYGQGSIGGRLRGSQQEGIAAVKISLLQQGNPQELQAVASDEQGVFRFERVAAGQYQIRVSHLAYALPADIAVEIGAGEVLELGDIALTEKTQQLQEVAVVADATRVVYRIDKNIVTVGQSLAAKATTAHGLMAHLPGVYVDASGAPRINNGSVKLLINGVPSSESLQDALGRIPSDMIDKVEVVTSPTLEYNLAGERGVINLILKKPKYDGYFFSPYAQMAYNGQKAKISNTLAGFDLNAKAKQFTFFLKYNHWQNKSFFKGELDMRDEQEGRLDMTRIDNAAVSEGNWMQAGVDIALKHTQITLSSAQKWVNNDTDEALRFTTAAGSSVERGFENGLLAAGKERMYDLNFNLQHAVGGNSDRTLKLDLSYLGIQNNDVDNRHYTQNSLLQGVSRTTEYNDKDFRQLFGKLQYTAYTGWGQLMAGADLHRLDNTHQYKGNDYLRAISGQQMRFEDGFYAVYGKVASQLMGLQYMASAKLDYISVNAQGAGGEVYDKSYVAPNATLTFRKAFGEERHQFLLNMGHMNSRVGMWLLNNIVPIYKPVIAVGNMDLHQSKINDVSLDYTYNKGDFRFNTNLSYRYVKDAWDTQLQQQGAVLLLKTRNIDSRQSTGLSGNIRYKWTGFWETMLSGNVSYVKVVNGGLLLNDGLSSYANMSNSFNLPKGFYFTTSVNYQGPQVYAVETHRPITTVNMHLSKRMFNGKATMNLDVTDLFNSNVTRQQLAQQVMQGDVYYRPYSQSIQLRFQCNIGYEKNRNRYIESAPDNSTRRPGF